MLPFNMIGYGNNVNDPVWYNGTELMAFDSVNYNANGFTDYVGNTMVVGTYVTSSSAAKPSSIGSKRLYNGIGGIDFNYAGYIARNSTNVSSWLNTAWTVDYWVAQKTTQTNMYLSASIIAVYTNTSFNSYTNRFLLSSGTNTINQYINTTSATKQWGQKYDDLLTSTYSHVAVTYDGTQFKIYTNGTLRQTIAQASFTMPTPNTALTVGIIGEGGTVPSNISTIERYRLRKGVQFTGNFSTSTLYNKG